MSIYHSKDTTEFECSNCKISLVKNIDTGFPYREGWIYVHKIELMIPVHNGVKDNIEVHKIIIQRKHFCSLNCFTDFISKLESFIKNHK